jgi:hypothetical protein
MDTLLTGPIRQCKTIVIPHFWGQMRAEFIALRNQMPQDKLVDPFGERAIQATAPSGKAGVFPRVAVGVFWFLVLALVAARIFSYH